MTKSVAQFVTVKKVQLNIGMRQIDKIIKQSYQLQEEAAGLLVIVRFPPSRSLKFWKVCNIFHGTAEFIEPGSEFLLKYKNSRSPFRFPSHGGGGVLG